jgi:hypothetical protein
MTVVGKKARRVKNKEAKLAEIEELTGVPRPVEVVPDPEPEPAPSGVELLQYPREYQPFIDKPPVTHEQMYAQSTSNDSVTVASWKNDWIHNYGMNKKKFGNFADHSLGKLFQKHLHMPAIVVGSGPHLKRNAHLLKDVKGIPIVSCLHNFHYMEDLGVDVDYYVSLDAGPVTIEEVSEGGDPSVDYWAKTKDKTLIAYACSHPELISKWQGKIYFYNCGVPDPEVMKALEDIELFNCHVSTGGNVLGAAVYIAKAFFGCSTIIFTGASFSFSSNEKFHAWDSKYDVKLGTVIKLPDIYGYKAKTWQSYANFANWFNFVAERVPGRWINCTEGGILGAYLDGNIRSIEQMDLKDCLSQYSMSEHIRPQAEDPKTSEVKILF